MEITGSHIYKNLKISQHDSISESFEELIISLKPSQILEIGAFGGGLTLLIRDLLDNNGLKNTRLITYDINTPSHLMDYVREGSKIDVRVKNIFNSDYNGLIDEQEIIDIIQSNGTTLVLCDGGNKINEFKILSNYLKVGDVIMAHDYSPNEEYFQKHINNQIWNWFEIQDSDIIDSCIKNSLISYMEEKFRNVVWVCKIKSQVLLSILVCSLLERNNTFLNKLINSVESQIGDNPVEFLVFSDNAKRSIGAKRNDLLRLSKGKYVSFIDDDDRISDTYIKDILNEIVNWSPDVIVFDAEISFNGSNNKLVKYGREYDYCEKSDAYYRHPNHLMVHKKENITEFFNNINFGEDDEWASRMLPRIVTQSRINKILYFYDYNTSTKKIIK